MSVREQFLSIPLVGMLFIVIRSDIQISRLRNTIYGEVSECYLIYQFLGNLMCIQL